MVNCGICGKRIDLGACQQTFGIYTQDIDENEKHRKERVHFCEVCNRKVKYFVQNLIYEHKMIEESRPAVESCF